MSQHDDDELRNTARILINQTRSMSYRGVGGGGGGGFGGSLSGHLPPAFDITRTHSINLITEEFLGGYMQDGRMSVVRRFFCLFVTFDLFFVSLLWLICIMSTGDNIFQAFQKQIVHYTIYTSLFDLVAAAICRFLVLIFFYALLYINHWLIIALSTSGSCLFLISKVFVFNWVASNQQVFEVILIITSFVLAWGEAWFLDCRVIPQERHARRYFADASSSDRSPLMAPFLASQGEHNQPESVANFYSPLDSAPNSDDDDEQDEEYHQMGINCVRKAYELLESSDWKVEKVTSKGDTIRSTQREKLGKIYRLTGRIKYPAKALLDELFYKIEGIPKWNPTVLESKIVHKINSYTDISYQATVGAGGGMVKSRDFVNLRCWRLYRNGKVVDDPDREDPDATTDDEILNCSYEGSVCTISDVESTPLPSSVESTHTQLYSSNSVTQLQTTNAFQTLSRSLGAKDFNFGAINIDPDEPPPLEEEFVDAKENLEESGEHHKSVSTKSAPASLKLQKDVVWISAAISIDFPKVPPTKYIRGENLVSGFALREIDGKSDACIFEWLLCLDLKGYIPRYVLDTAYTTFMTDYMIYMRKYVNELQQKRKNVPRRN